MGSDSKFGVIFAGGYSSTWRTRERCSRPPRIRDLDGSPWQNFRAVTTDNRVIVNGLLGLGYEFGDQKLRWTNLYIHDTRKQARIASGFSRSIGDLVEGEPDQAIEQGTYWFERQLIDTQLVGEFKFET